MAIKYFIQYKDAQNVDYTIKIKSDSYSSFPITIGGYAIIDRPEVDEIYTVIRGSSITLKLEANLNLTFEDLYSENEKEYTVELYRGLNPIFIGYIDPSGLFEDLVNDNWEISLRCVDGLGLLDNLSYVDDNGQPFLGKQNDLNVIYNCLHRTGLYQENGEEMILESSINTMYVFAEDNLGPLPNVYSNQERFYKDDGETVMSCLEVLESTLRKYGGAITQENGKWKVFSFYELLAGNRNFYTYKGNVYLNTISKDYPEQTIGSQILEDSIFWCNDNQRKEIIPSIGAVKVNYKYGFVKSIFNNINLINNGTTVTDWNILNASLIDLGTSGRGVKIESDISNTSVIETNPVSLSENDTLEVIFQYNVQDSSASQKVIEFDFQLQVSSGGTTYYYNQAGQWTTSVSNAKFVNGFGLNGSFNNKLTTSAIPIDGNFKLVLKQSGIVETVSGLERTLDVQITEVSASAAADKSIQGENHTYQVEGTSTRVEDVVDISVGDNFSDVYLGALYKQDENTNTNIWQTVYTPSDIVGNQPILQILSEYIALHKRQPLYAISGDAFGHFDYLQVFVFPLIPNRKFMITSYNLNTKTGIGSYTFIELKRGNTFGLTYEYNLDYGNVVRPTIIG